MLTAKVLKVSAKDLNDRTGKTAYDFKVYEFENGLILVPGDSTNDWFFDDRDSIEACGNDIVTGIVETGDTHEWTIAELQMAVAGSISEFGSVPDKVAEFIPLPV